VRPGGARPADRLWNRNAIFDIFRRELARAEREGNPLSIVIENRIELDRLLAFFDALVVLA
jgi:hypothetical protein